MICHRCNVEMLPGVALVPGLRAGLPDFPGEPYQRGQTLSEGPGRMGPVLKCPQCGHSVKVEENA